MRTATSLAKSFGHRRFARDFAPRILQNRSALGEQPRGVELGRHVRELPLNALKLRDGLAKLAPFLDILQRRIERAAPDAQRQCGNRDAAAIENPHRIDESFAFDAEQIFRGNLAVLEDQFAGIAGPQTELVFFLARPESLVPFSTRNADSPCVPLLLSVTAMTTATSAYCRW
jgi:hypothetical protein